MISRTTLATHIWIVGNKEFAISKMWEIICRKSQWTDMMETVLSNLSTNADGVQDAHAQPDYIPIPEVFPYRICDIQLPHSDGGYVYLLVSLKQPSFTYVGETNNIARRLVEHNSGHGSRSTRPSHLIPYHIAAYIITHSMDVSGRMSLEHRWQLRNQQAHRQGNSSIMNLIDIGRDIVNQHNTNVGPRCAERHLRFVSHMESR